MSSNETARLLCALLLCWAGAAGAAETLNCPTLADAVQVGVCPDEEELRYTFKGYCSDNARMYDGGDRQVCTDYALYRNLKNVSLWETRDGRFAGYLSCDPRPAAPADAAARKLTIGKQGSVTRVACHYDAAAVLSHRTKAHCVATVAECGPGTACQATCE